MVRRIKRVHSEKLDFINIYLNNRALEEKTLDDGSEFRTHALDKAM